MEYIVYGQMWNPFAREYEPGQEYGIYPTLEMGRQAALRIMEHPRDRFSVLHAYGPDRSVQYGSPVTFTGPVPEQYLKRGRATRRGIHPDWLEKEL